MAIETPARTWITGEEYNRERRRLLDAGYTSRSPEYQALARRIDERNDHIWETYGAAIMKRHPGKWAAIVAAGDYLLADSELEVFKLARQRFGPGNALICRLTPDRGVHRLGPRSG